MGRAAFVQLLVIQSLILDFCLAITYQNLPLDSGLYMVDSPWMIKDGEYKTTHGTIVASFRASHFMIEGPYNPNATLSLYIDGYYVSTRPDGQFTSVGVDDGDHQISLVVQAPEEVPYVFRGIGLPISNGVNLNATKDYIPQTYGVNASVVPAGTIIMDDTDPCVQYSTGWYQSRDWKSYNETLTVSNASPSTMTIYFLGPSIWLFSSQSVIYYPALASISGTLDSENITDLSFNATTPVINPVTQKLLWSRTNLTNTLHVLKLNVSHSEYDSFSFDFARVEGKPTDCESITNPSDPTSTMGTTKIALIVCVSVLSPILLIACFFFLRWKQKKRLQQQQSLAYSEKQSEGGNKSEISDDSSSFRTILNRTRRTGLQATPLTSSEDPPRSMAFPKVTVTPFVPTALDENEEPHEGQRRGSGKSQDTRPRTQLQLVSPSAGGAASETVSVSENMASVEETGSPLSSSPPALELSLSPMSPSLPRPILARQQSGSSLTPPPSYRTELQSWSRRRAAAAGVGGARVLTQEELGRLVNRVSALRGWRRPSGFMAPRVEEDPFADEEDDAVETLARQIAESGTLGSDGTRLRTEMDLQ